MKTSSCIYCYLMTVAILVVSPVGMGQTAKIMPLGDSITRGTNDINYPNGSIPGGYRRGLGERLAAAGHRYDFVGNNTDNAYPGMDPDHNGNNGFRTDQMLAGLSGWLAVDPDTVLLHAGSNDILQNVPVATAINNLSSLITTITSDTARRLYVATIIPITQDWQGRTAAYLNGNANTYNAQVRTLVQQYANQGRNVFLVEMNGSIVLTNPNPALNFYQPGDGIHPGQAGYNQMGAIWFNAITSTGSLLPDAYLSWSSNYPAFTALPAGDQLPSADPNHDGLSNLLAFAFNVDPLGNLPASARPALSVDSNPANPSSFFQFRRSKIADVNFEILVSSDLSPNNWQIQNQSGAMVTSINGDTDTELVTVPLGAGGTRKFARLRVTRN
ncbi:MAG: SGNH/GDSL hydrolase family protein [Luteolibacter sp.]|uniref:SGNH/GDSL hydrolase family protein n=1 Tax=Luteolibacter sp. TaxID=1962973 RepID=UPI003262D781